MYAYYIFVLITKAGRQTQHLKAAAVQSCKPFLNENQIKPRDKNRN